MKVAICSDAFFLKSNTVANHISVLVKGLKEFGHEVKIFTSDIEITKVENTDEICSFPGKQTESIYQQKTAFFSLFKLDRALSSFSPEIIHIFSLNSLGVFCVRYALKHNIPVVSTIFNFNDCFTIGRPSLLSIVKTYFYRKAGLYILTNSQEIVSFTPNAQELLEKLGITHKKIIRIPCCVDTDLFGPDTANPERVQKMRVRFGIDHDRSGILYAGSLFDKKRVDELFETWSGTVRPADRLKLILAGPCDDPDGLHEMAKLRGIVNQVAYVGEILHEDMPSCYRACDAFLCITDDLAVHFSPLEAIACGLPALVHISSSNRYLIRDGVNGFVYKSNGELRGLLQNFSALDATGKRMLRNLVSGTMKGMDAYEQADSMEAIYYGAVSTSSK
jgi:1,2-diacylglycerol 3-alpha-glucosyltransferase